MADQKWTEQDPAGAITGSEITSVVQSGSNKRTTLNAIFAALGITPDQLVDALANLITDTQLADAISALDLGTAANADLGTTGTLIPNSAQVLTAVGDAIADFVAGLPAIEDAPPGTVDSVLGVDASSLLVQQNLLDLLGTLQYLRSLTPAADKVPYFNGAAGATLADLTAYGRQIIGVADRAALMTLYNLTYADIHGGTSVMPGLGSILFGDLGASILAGIPSTKYRTSGAANDGMVVSSIGISAGPGTTGVTVAIGPDGSAAAWRVTNAAAGAGSIRSALNDTSLDAYMRRGEAGQVRSVRPSGAVVQTMPRWVGVSNLATLVSGTLVLAAVSILAGEIISSVSWVTRTTAGSGMTNQWFVLLDANRVVRAVSADDTATAWGANTVKTLNMGVAYTIPADGNYYLGVMVAGTTVPTFAGVVNTTAVLTGIAPVSLATSSTGQTTPPALGATMGALANITTGMPYGYAS